MQSSMGIGRLWNVINDAIDDKLQKLSPYTEFGQIKDDMSLQLSRFSIPFPPASYMLARSLTLHDPVIITESYGTPAHTHDIAAVRLVPRLQPGDIVIVMWVNDQMPAVIDVLVNGTTLGV